MSSGSRSAATTTYYVDEEFPQGFPDVTGEITNGIGAGAFFTANDIRGLYFDVINPILLQSFDVYSNSAGNRTIEIIDAQGNTYADTTIFIPASPNSPTTVNVNFTIYPGTNYFIKCRGNVDLYRNSGGAIYPYTSSSVNVTGSNAGSPGYYYFFYFWNYTEITCNTGRTACAAVDTCAAVGINDLFSNNSFEIFPNPSNGEFNVHFNAAKQDNYTITVTNSVGEKIYDYKLNGFAGEFNQTIDLGVVSKGLYMVNISTADNIVTRKLNIH